MKHIKSIYLFTFALVIFGCELTQPLEDFQPNFSLDAETAISDQSSAELALAGMYSGFQQGGGSSGMAPYNAMLPSWMGLTADVSGFAASWYPELNGFTENNPRPDARQVGELYSDIYKILNRANWIIEKVEKVSADEFMGNRQAEIIGEAKFARALCHFYGLRSFGYFYDKNADLGIVLKTTPSRDAEPVGRSSVNEVYTQILSDLDDAIANAPEFREHYYASKTAAKAIKSKVLLYMEDFDGAAGLAKEIIDNVDDNFALAATFDEIWLPTPASFNSSEAIFSVFSGQDGQGTAMGNWYGFEAAVSLNYEFIASDSVMIDGNYIHYDGPRLALVKHPFEDNGKYPEAGDTYFHMRMAELYLIYAEATVRSGGDLQSALDALNAIRTRAGVQVYPDGRSADELLNLIRMEKIMELACEGGEEWFDMVRYAYLDQGFEAGFKVSDQKPTAVDPSKFTLPIPQENIDVNGGVLVQAPGY